jgi:hypothetical protein
MTQQNKPTVEELLDACGDDIEYLKLLTTDSEYGVRQWVAKERGYSISYAGLTPQEAINKLLAGIKHRDKVVPPQVKE